MKNYKKVNKNYIFFAIMSTISVVLMVLTLILMVLEKITISKELIITSLLTVIVIVIPLHKIYKTEEKKEDIFKMYLKASIKTFVFIMLMLSLVLIPLIVFFISKYFGDGSTLQTGDWMSFFGTYFGVIISLCGIYWQVKRSEYRKEQEENNKKSEEMRNVITYITHCLENNVGLEDEKTIGMFGFPLKYAHILLLKHTDVNKTKKFFYEFDKDYMSRNIEKILTLKQGKRILEINDETIYLNELIFKNIDYFDLFDIQKDISLLVEQYNLDINEWNGFFINLIKLHLSLINELIFTHGEEFKNSNWNSLLNNIKEFTQINGVPDNNKILFNEFEKYLHSTIIKRGDYILDIYIKQLNMLYFLIESILPEVMDGYIKEFKLKELAIKIKTEKLLMNQLKTKVPTLLIDVINVKRELKKMCE